MFDFGWAAFICTVLVMLVSLKLGYDSGKDMRKPNLRVKINNSFVSKVDDTILEYKKDTSAANVYSRGERKWYVYKGTDVVILANLDDSIGNRPQLSRAEAAQLGYALLLLSDMEESVDWGK